ncbi:Putative sulfate permease [Modestobacter italicus]|uniref:Sulfate permease n=1 Tax=Modestobacter italicus (strain DSM 44449 / CECT 9708 / BC 501) TaxID=2732864 RepID=I4EYI8_MODI5|nr:DUF308 domain-containing protein [Modestobacter marinus]CCH88451.1 Putative sulfate permease [Modestobacter marinus]
MTGAVLERRHSMWDVILGVLLVIAGLVILAHVFLATVVSVLLLGWLALVAGVVALVAAIFQIGRGGFWATALSGGLLLVLGLMMLRNPGAAALTLTLLAGALFLAGGIVRLIMAFDRGAPRAALILSGVIGVVLGLIVLFNLFTATFTLLGVLLGVQALSDGIMLLLFGRLRVRRTDDLDRTTGNVRPR